MKKLMTIAASIIILHSIYVANGQQSGAISAANEKIRKMADMDAHLNILQHIDSLKNAQIYSPELAWQYARSLFQSGRYDLAKDSLQIWISDSIRSIQAHNMLTQIAIQQRNYNEAIGYLMNLSEKHPQNPVYPHRLARIYLATNRLFDAEQQLNKAHSLDSLNEIVLSDWADVLMKLESYPLANEILQKGIAISPDNLSFLQQKALLDYRLQKHKQVIQTAELLLAKGDTTPQIVKVMALAYYQTDSLSLSEIWLDYLINQNLGGEDISFYKGKNLMSRGKNEEAQKYFMEAVNQCLSSNFNPFVLQVGINYFDMRKYRESIAWLQMARNFSSSPMLLFYLGLNYYYHHEDKSNAQRYLGLFLEQSTKESEAGFRTHARSMLRHIAQENHFKQSAN